MARHHKDWLKAYVEYSSFTETPEKMRYWAGVSAISGVLRRKVFIDQYYFQWFPNFYIIFVADPDIVSKSTTAGTAMKLLRQVPGIIMGPNVATWQALIQSLHASQEEQIGDDGKPIKVAAITISSSEFGNFLNPDNTELVDMLVSLWDGTDISKVTKGSGKEEVPFPLLNLNACTTPAWIQGNIPAYMLGGGLISRCVFVFADQKEKYIAYPGLHVPKNIKDMERELVEDLIDMSTMCGEFAITREAIDWGQAWYEQTFKGHSDEYITRRQTHVHKLAIIIAASKRQDNYITKEDLMEAVHYIQLAGRDLNRVVESIGRSTDAAPVDRLLSLIKREGRLTVEEAYGKVHGLFPKANDFTNVLEGLVKAGFVHYTTENGVNYITKKAKKKKGEEMSEGE